MKDAAPGYSPLRSSGPTTSRDVGVDGNDDYGGVSGG